MTINLIMSTTNATVIELTPTYTLITARSLLTDRPVYLDLFSHQPTWLICLNKSSLSLIKKFHSLNKNFHYPYHCLVFSNPESTRKKLGLNCDKGEIFWVEKRFREEIYQSLQIIQLPWILIIEEGTTVYSAHDFPPDFTSLSSYKDQPEKSDSPVSRDMRKIATFKEQIQLLKQRVRKQEKKEVEYKTEISELKNKEKVASSEVVELKRKVKELELKAAASPEIEFKKYLPGVKEKESPNGTIIGYPKASDDIWRVREDGEFKDLEEITEYRDLWISSLENKTKGNGYKAQVKLFPIAKSSGVKNVSSKEFSNKRTTPEPPKLSSRRHIY